MFTKNDLLEVLDRYGLKDMLSELRIFNNINIPESKKKEQAMLSKVAGVETLKSPNGYVHLNVVKGENHKYMIYNMLLDTSARIKDIDNVLKSFRYRNYIIEKFGYDPDKNIKLVS